MSELINKKDLQHAGNAAVMLTPCTYGIHKAARALEVKSRGLAKVVAAAEYIAAPIDTLIQVVATPIFSAISDIIYVQKNRKHIPLLYWIVFPLSMALKAAIKTLIYGVPLILTGLFNVVVPYKLFNALISEASWRDFFVAREVIRRDFSQLDGLDFGITLKTMFHTNKYYYLKDNTEKLQAENEKKAKAAADAEDKLTEQKQSETDCQRKSADELSSDSTDSDELSSDSTDSDHEEDSFFNITAEREEADDDEFQRELNELFAENKRRLDEILREAEEERAKEQQRIEDILNAHLEELLRAHNSQKTQDERFNYFFKEFAYAHSSANFNHFNGYPFSHSSNADFFNSYHDRFSTNAAVQPAYTDPDLTASAAGLRTMLQAETLEAFKERIKSLKDDATKEKLTLLLNQIQPFLSEKRNFDYNFLLFGAENGQITLEELNKRKNFLSMYLHPDKNQGVECGTQVINDAYDRIRACAISE